MSDTSLFFNFLVGRDTASPHMKKVANAATAMTGQVRMASLVGSAAIGTLAIGLAGLGANAIALAAALAPLIGLLGLLPISIVGAGAGLGTLLIGFSGLAAAMGSAAGGAGVSAQAIVSAEQRVADAQREALRAQLAINDAREEAADRLADYGRQLNRAHIDEKRAIQAVKDAKKARDEARRGGSRDERVRADLNYEDALASLDEVRARLEAVTAEERRRREAGVEGSDEVQSAVERQERAVRGLAEAEAALAQAQSGGGGANAAAEAYAKLTAEGKALVDTLHQIAPAWRQVQSTVQSSLLVGAGAGLAVIASMWLPMLQTELGGIGTAWNEGFSGFYRLATTQSFVDDFATSLHSIAGFTRQLAGSFGPFFSGFRHWMVIGSAFLPEIGQWILDIANGFDRWSDAARNTGRGHAWIAVALTTLSQLWSLLKNVGGALGAVVTAGSGGSGWLGDLAAAAGRLSDTLSRPETQAQMASMFEKLREAGSSLNDVLMSVGAVMLDMFDDAGLAAKGLDVFNAAAGFLADHMDTLAEVMPVVVAAFVAFKVAQIAATAAQWALNIALNANPIGLVVVIIYALIAAVVLLWYHWDFIWVGIRATIFLGHMALNDIGRWFAGPFVDFFKDGWHRVHVQFDESVAFIMGWVHRFIDPILAIKDHIAQHGIWDTLVSGFKIAVNSLIRIWNNFELPIGGGALFPGGPSLPGFTLTTPDVPYLDVGGDILKTGVAVVHKGERVQTAAEVQRGSGGSSSTVLEIHGDGSDVSEFILHVLRKAVRVRGGDVQLVIGR